MVVSKDSIKNQLVWSSPRRTLGRILKDKKSSPRENLMKKVTLGGLILIASGVVLFVLSTVEFKRQQEVLRVGAFRATATTSRTVPTFRYVSFWCLGADALLTILGLAKR